MGERRGTGEGSPLIVPVSCKDRGKGPRELGDTLVRWSNMTQKRRLPSFWGGGGFDGLEARKKKGEALPTEEREKRDSQGRFDP